MKGFAILKVICISSLLLFSNTSFVTAETNEVSVSIQPGLLYLPLIVMEQNNFLEEALKKESLKDTKVKWFRISGSTAIQDALLSGSLSFAAGGIPPFLQIWEKSRGSFDVKAVTAMSSMPISLMTRDPELKTAKDLTGTRKIAVPAVKSSIQAILLQMESERLFGVGKPFEFDKLTVSMRHPDAMSALLTNQIDAHFASPPFNYYEKQKGLHSILNSYDLVGKGTSQVVWCTSKFRGENPKTYKAFLSAFEKAIVLIKQDKKAAADAYARSVGRPQIAEETLAIISDPNVEYSSTPRNMMKIVSFMHRIGTLKSEPKDWKEMFYPEVHNLPGS